MIKLEKLWLKSEITDQFQIILFLSKCLNPVISQLIINEGKVEKGIVLKLAEFDKYKFFEFKIQFYIDFQYLKKNQSVIIRGNQQMEIEVKNIKYDIKLMVCSCRQ
ncbi:hypothetical protein pb186bvf_008591 [Paramecium bursaria]